MNRILLLTGFLLFFQTSYSQIRLRTIFPKSAVNVQYAGSTGLVTAGFFKVTKRDKFELGILYGILPKSFGGPGQSLTLKGIYNPFQFYVLKRVVIEPLQTGIFMSQNFNENSGLSWGQKYPKGYYWWNRSTRFHLFASAQVSYKIESAHLDRVSCYFEANTNDLYLYSYFPNMETMSLYDIIFFGTGVKVYVK